jgi:LysR family transcriptional regulator, hydrogen peroxide-inducible genes activator
MRVATGHDAKAIIVEMHQIKYFLAVCSERNFSRAAKLCQISQPSLTRAIKLLEAELGGALFRRSRNQSKLTELGEIVRPRLQNAWDKSEAAIANARQFAATRRLAEVQSPAAAKKPIRDCER